MAEPADGGPGTHCNKRLARGDTLTLLGLVLGHTPFATGMEPRGQEVRGCFALALSPPAVQLSILGISGRHCLFGEGTVKTQLEFWPQNIRVTASWQDNHLNSQ